MASERDRKAVQQDAVPPVIRVLHCPHPVGGHAPQLARSERELGVASWSVAFSRSPFSQRCDEILWPDPTAVVRNECARWRLLWRAVKDFDVVHFNFGTPIFPRPIAPRPAAPSRTKWVLRRAFDAYAGLLRYTDLRVLSRLGKAVFVTYQGDDARQSDFCRQHFAINAVEEVGPGYYSPESDARKREEIATFDRFAARIYSLNPDLLHVLPSRAGFLPYGHVDPRVLKPAQAASTNSRPLVVHPPTHRGVKGTRVILDAVSRLRAEGIDFNFQLVEGMPNEEARRLYERADLLVDQVLLGWYGGVAVEAMALGTPVIAYIRTEDLKFVPDPMRSELPIIEANPGTVYEVLKKCLTTERSNLAAIGLRGRRFVERWHDPLRIASGLREDYLAALHAVRPGTPWRAEGPARREIL